MARYSREQRDRAVDLYIKYERCAADVIHDRLSQQGRVAVVVRGPARGGAHRRPLQARGTLQALQRRAETGRGGPLPRMRQTAQPHHADARLSEKQGAAHGVDRRAGARPTQTEARARARGTETRGGGRGRVRTVEITRGGRRTGRGGVRREKLETTDARRIQGDARDEGTQGKDQERKGWRTARGSGRAGGRRRPEGRGRSGGGAGVDGEETCGDAGPSGRAGRQHRGPTTDRTRDRHPDRDPEGRVGAVGKEPGTDPENLTSREKTILVKTVSETMGVTARSLLSVVGIARSMCLFNRS